MSDKKDKDQLELDRIFAQPPHIPDIMNPTVKFSLYSLGIASVITAVALKEVSNCFFGAHAIRELGSAGAACASIGVIVFSMMMLYGLYRLFTAEPRKHHNYLHDSNWFNHAQNTKHTLDPFENVYTTKKKAATRPNNNKAKEDYVYLDDNNDESGDSSSDNEL